jgi:hypothetical protein
VNLQQLRDYIRAQLDMDEEELPNLLLDTYLSEAFMRTISQEVRWPFYEHRWDVTKTDGLRTIVIPTDCDPVGIMSLIDSSSGARLTQIGAELADDNFRQMNAEGLSYYYSIEANLIHLHPAHAEGVGAYHLRGHRYPIDWIAGGASAEPDCDHRLHQLLAHYAIALCYAQQEDEVLEDVYMKRWQASFITAHHAICSPRHHRPVIFNGGIPATPAIAPAYWSSPPVHP